MTDASSPEQMPLPDSGRRKHRGGQPCNQNALKHGFYSKAVPPELSQKLEEAAKIRGLDQEIALLRSKLAIAGEKGTDYRELVPGMSLLSRLLNIQHKLGDDDKVKNGVAKIWANLLPPGVNPLQAYVILKQLQAEGKLPPPPDDPEDQETFENAATNHIECPAEPESGGLLITNPASPQERPE